MSSQLAELRTPMTPPSLANTSVVVGIATHNRCDELRKSIASALNQSHAPLRVTVIDDASSDETPKLRDEFKNVSWERLEQAQGYVRARNKMMLTAAENYYVSLDDDSWFIKGDEIAIAVDFLERHPQVAAVALDILSPDHPNQISRGAERSVALFIGCGHLLRLSVVKELGGYAEFPGAYGVEEKDFCLRLIDAGYQIVKLDGVHVWHDKSLRARDIPRQHCSGVCNDLALTLRRVPIVILLPVLVGKVSGHISFAVRAGLLRPCLEGLRNFIFAAADVWRTRRPVRLASLARFRALSRSSSEVSG
jgi:GT2 family glycosyltransferase